MDMAAAVYQPVAVSGHFLNGKEALVQAVTAHGGGFWVITPFLVEQGSAPAFVVLVNRGFVPPERRDPKTRAAGRGDGATIVGLLRQSEPGGGFLRHNDPAHDRWYSRDVTAIAKARGAVECRALFHRR